MIQPLSRVFSFFSGRGERGEALRHRKLTCPDEIINISLRLFGPGDNYNSM